MPRVFQGTLKRLCGTYVPTFSVSTGEKTNTQLSLLQDGHSTVIHQHIDKHDTYTTHSTIMEFKLLLLLGLKGGLLVSYSVTLYPTPKMKFVIRSSSSSLCVCLYTFFYYYYYYYYYRFLFFFVDDADHINNYYFSRRCGCCCAGACNRPRDALSHFQCRNSHF